MADTEGSPPNPNSSGPKGSPTGHSNPYSIQGPTTSQQPGFIQLAQKSNEFFVRACGDGLLEFHWNFLPGVRAKDFKYFIAFYRDDVLRYGVEPETVLHVHDPEQEEVEDKPIQRVQIIANWDKGSQVIRGDFGRVDYIIGLGTIDHKLEAEELEQKRKVAQAVAPEDKGAVTKPAQVAAVETAPKKTMADTATLTTDTTAEPVPKPGTTGSSVVVSEPLDSGPDLMDQPTQTQADDDHSSTMPKPEVEGDQQPAGDSHATSTVQADQTTTDASPSTSEVNRGG